MSDTDADPTELAVPAEPVSNSAEPDKSWRDPVKTYTLTELSELKNILFPTLSPSNILPTTETAPTKAPAKTAAPILPESVEEEAPAREEAPEPAPATRRRKARWI